MPVFVAPQWDGSEELTPDEARLRFRLRLNPGQTGEAAYDCEVYVRLPGDANGDDVVSAPDFILLRDFITPNSDFDSDGRVTALDFLILRDNVGRRRVVE